MNIDRISIYLVRTLQVTSTDMLLQVPRGVKVDSIKMAFSPTLLAKKNNTCEVVIYKIASELRTIAVSHRCLWAIAVPMPPFICHMQNSETTDFSNFSFDR